MCVSFLEAQALCVTASQVIKQVAENAGKLITHAG